MFSWLPNSKFHRFWLITSVIKTDHSIYRSSLGVLLEIYSDNLPCCGMEGVWWGIYQWIWSIWYLASATASALFKAASFYNVVSVNLNLNPWVAFPWCYAQPKTSFSIILTWSLPNILLLLVNSCCLLTRSRSNPLDNSSESLALIF